MARCVDHLGKEYPSFRALAEAYGVPYSTLYARIRTYGWDLEKALTEPVVTGITARQIGCRDGKGREYASLKEMADAYGIGYTTLLARHKKGLEPEELVKPAARIPARADHTGKEYPNLKALAEAYGLPHGTLVSRLRGGWTMEDALTIPVGSCPAGPQGVCRDHQGNEYPTKAAMAKAYGIPPNVFGARLSKGWDIEKALTRKPGDRKKKKGDG